MPDKPFYKIYGEQLLSTIIPNHMSDIEKSKKHDYLSNLVNENIAEPLYRFRSCSERDFDAFGKNRIYFNNPQNFNDPHDCLVFVDFECVHNEIQKQTHALNLMLMGIMSGNVELGSSKQIIGTELHEMLHESLVNLTQDAKYSDVSAQINQLAQHIEDEVIADCGFAKKYFRDTPQIACFSSEILNSQMWSYYADYHRGFALEYSDLMAEMTACPQECESLATCKDYPVNCRIYPVVYTDVKYDATDFAKYQSAKRLFTLVGLNIDSLMAYDELAYQKANIFKANCWAHEKEWRMSLICPNPRRNWVAHKPTAIYLGAKISDINKNILLHLATENNITVFQMDEQPNSIEYKMCSTPVLIFCVSDIFQKNNLGLPHLFHQGYFVNTSSIVRYL